eukprot:symbB.v1.2.025948.t1/scaffold2552.1/size76460/1
MSHATYQNKWVECMQELMEQVQIEYLPVDAKENGQHFEPGFQHFALLYIKYLQIYRKLEECHDQMVHPQKRGSIKKVLKSTIIRILELKEQLITFNLRPLNRFVALDEALLLPSLAMLSFAVNLFSQVLTDLKLNPETVEWKVPRYFLDGKECREEIEDKQHKIDHWLGVFGMPLEPDDLLDKKDPFEVGLTTDQAVAIIQKNERGRMNIVKADHRVQFFKASKKDASKKQESAEDPLESQVLAATRIAAHWKRKMREEEFEFLGMAPPKKDKGETDVIVEMQKHRDNRKKMQEDADDVFEKALKQQLEWLQKKKGADIKAELLEERRQWILDYCQFPEKFDLFYQRFDQKNEEDEGDKGKDGKKGKDAKGKNDKDKGKGGKGGKKGKDGDGEEEPLEVVSSWLGCPPHEPSGMWGFLQDAEVSLDSINRGLMLPLSRESWVLKEAPCIIGSPVKNDDWERSAVAAHFIASREQCQGSSRPQSRQSSRPRSRPSSTQGCRKPKRTAASLSELKESASNRAATWLKSYAAYEQSELLQVALTLGNVRRNSLQRMSSAPETLRPSSATNRGHDRAAATNLQRSQYGRHMRKQCLGLRCEGEERPLYKEERSGWPAPWADAAPPSPSNGNGIRCGLFGLSDCQS